MLREDEALNELRRKYEAMRTSKPPRMLGDQPKRLVADSWLTRLRCALRDWLNKPSGAEVAAVEIERLQKDAFKQGFSEAAGWTPPESMPVQSDSEESRA